MTILYMNLRVQTLVLIQVQTLAQTLDILYKP